jgi:hypothetical protein
MQSPGVANLFGITCFTLALGERSGYAADLGLQSVFLILSEDVTACSPTDDI